jgi:uncharacterized protein (TIGR02597 family)
MAGFVNLTLLGNSDNFISLPFLRPATAQGSVLSASSNLLTATGSPGWSAHQFSNCYVRFTSGAAEGSMYAVLSNTANTITVNGTLNSVSTDDAFSVEPYWTFKTVFANGAGVNVSPTVGDRRTEVLIPDFTSRGINLSASKIYYFNAGLWKQVGQGSTDHGDDIFLPNTHFVVRHNVATNTVLTTYGVVPTSKLAITFNSSTTNRQDNYIGLARPAVMSLDASGLISSGAFAASPLPGDQTDQLLTFDNAVAQRNKSSSAVYYFWNGAWRRVGAGTSNVGADPVFSPGAAVAVRKGTNSPPQVWVNAANY